MRYGDSIRPNVKTAIAHERSAHLAIADFYIFLGDTVHAQLQRRAQRPLSMYRNIGRGNERALVFQPIRIPIYRSVFELSFSSHPPSRMAHGIIRLRLVILLLVGDRRNRHVAREC